MTEDPADIKRALKHLGFDSVADLHYWAIDDNELNRFDALVQQFKEHREDATASLRKQLEDAREALRQWWCIGCNGTGQIGVMVNGEYRSEKHHHCDGVGLEPIAREALKGNS